MAVDDYLMWARAQGSPASTRDTRRQQLQHLARRTEVGPWAVTGPVLLEYVAAQDWKPETRRSRRTTLRAFYRWALEAGHVTASPALSLPRVPPSPPNPRPAPDRVYLHALAVADERERLILRLAAEHGMRRAEVAQVHSRDVVEDLDGWSLWVHGKGDKLRMVPLKAEVAAMLRARPAGYAFPGNVDGHLSPRWVGKLISRLLLDDWTMHPLRHRAATNWHDLEKDLMVVGELLGHASVATTQRYVKTRSSAKRRHVEEAAA